MCWCEQIRGEFLRFAFDHVDMARACQATKKKYMRKLERIFSDVDVSGDGLISEEEFTNMLQDICHV